jgi:hypothetical protein
MTIEKPMVLSLSAADKGCTPEGLVGAGNLQ